MKKTLYVRQKGKQMHASGSWDMQRREKIMVYAIMAFFAGSVTAVLIGSVIYATTGRKGILIPSIICLVISFLSLFCALFGLTYKKSRSKPMDVHYYDVDYSYSAADQSETDNTHEIYQEEYKEKLEKKNR